MSSINIETKRFYISNAYEGIGWKEKVMRMRPAQVVAVYNKFKKDGKIDAVRRRLQPTKKDIQVHQISIAEYMEGR